MEKKPIVSLQIYKGEKLSYNKDGSLQNERINDLIASAIADSEGPEITTDVVSITFL